MERKYIYRAEYSPSDKAKCKFCKEKIQKGVLRLVHLVNAPTCDVKYTKLYHAKCFFIVFHPTSEHAIKNFARLKIEDQDMVLDTIAARKSMKRKSNGNAEEEPAKKKIKCDQGQHSRELIRNQTNELHELREKVARIHISIQKGILKNNGQKVPRRKKDILDHLTDVIFFGAIEPCVAENCNKANFVFDGNYLYRCSGYVSGYGKCNESRSEPKRRPLQIESDILDEYPFLNHEFSGKHRALNAPVHLPTKKRSSNGTLKPVLDKMTFKDGAIVDQKSKLENVAHVYNKSGVMYSVTLDKVDLNPSGDKNSYYKMQLLESDASNPRKYWIFQAWGRINEKRCNHMCKELASLDDGLKTFHKLFKDKTLNPFGESKYKKYLSKYHVVQSTDKDIQKAYKTAESVTINEPLQKLIKLLVNKEMTDELIVNFDIDTSKLPLGKISRDQINEAFKVLKEIAINIRKGWANEHLIEPSNRFYSLIPHKVDCDDTIVSVEHVFEKVNILKCLKHMTFTYSFTHKETGEEVDDILNDFYGKLNARVKPLERHSDEFSVINEYMEDTKMNYNLAIEDIFTVSQNDDAFNHYLNNKRLLWHGTRIQNVASILVNGLKIAPSEAVIGCFLGKGHYFSDVAANSVQYCYAESTKNTGVILLFEVALGDSLRCHDPDNIEVLPEGIHSVHGVGAFSSPNTKELDGLIIPEGKPIKDEAMKTHIDYNEYVVYKSDQIKLKYLVKFRLLS